MRDEIIRLQAGVISRTAVHHRGDTHAGCFDGDSHSDSTEAFARGTVFLSRVRSRIAGKPVEFAQYPVEHGLVDFFGIVLGQRRRSRARQAEGARRYRGPFLRGGGLRGIELACRMAGNRHIDMPAFAMDGQLRIEFCQIAEPRQRQIAQIDLIDVHVIDVGIPGSEHAGGIFRSQCGCRRRVNPAAARCEQQGDERKRQRRTGTILA